MRARGIAGLSFIVVAALSLRATAGNPPATPAAPAAGAPAAPTTSFEQLSDGATRIAREDLAGWAWAMTAACDQGDDVAQRQCRVVRDARAATQKTQTFIVDGEPTAFMVGAWDPAKKSVTLTVRGCVACAPVDLGGKKVFIVSNKAAPTETGGVLQAAVIHETARIFQDEAAATAWRSDIVPRLRVELVFALPAGNPVWSRNGKDGIAVQVLGFRVHDPCDGGIVCSSPVAVKLDPDKKSCGQTVDEGKADGDVAPDEAIPDRLEPWMIQKALVPALGLAQQCHETYGVDGQTKLRLTIAGDGSLVTLDQTGDFNDTPTGACIAKAVKTVTFPKTHKARTTVSYPIVLR